MDPHRIAGATFSTDRKGISTFKIPWVVYTQDQLDTFEPSDPPLGLTLVERSGNEDGGDWVLWLLYEGIKKGKETVDLFELDCSTAEQPIDTYPDFGYPRWAKYQWDKEKREFPRDITIDGQPGINPLYGTTSYLDINPIWRRMSVATDFPKDLLSAVGCIDKPTGKIPPPTLPNSRDWLKRSLRASWRGNCWDITEEWLASGRYQWNRDIYKATDVPAR